MANQYYIISEVQFFLDKHDKKSWDFVSGTGIDLSGPCNSRRPTLTEIKQALVDFGLETNDILNQKNRIEISATQKGGEGLWLIFTDMENQKQEVSMFEVGRGTNPDLIIDFIKLLGKTHGRFLYYCDNGGMTLITKDKDTEKIKEEIYNRK
jgi:hypothetical protein